MCSLLHKKKEVICFSYQFQLPALSLKIEVASYLHSYFSPLLKGNSSLEIHTADKELVSSVRFTKTIS